MVKIKTPEFCVRSKIVLVTPDEKVIAFKRHPKDTRPLFWDLLGGGPKVFAGGGLESLEDATIREMYEEARIDYYDDPPLLGRLRPLPLVEVTKIYKKNRPKIKFTQIYIAGTIATERDIILPKEHEVEEGDFPHIDVAFFPVDEFVNLHDNESSPEQREAIWKNPDVIFSAGLEARAMQAAADKREAQIVEIGSRILAAAA